MLKSVLIGLDNTPYSEAAVTLAISWAKATPMMLVGIGVIDPGELAGGESTPLGASHFKASRDLKAVEDARDDVEQRLQRFSVRCAEAGVSSKILEGEGNPAGQIAREAQRCDLILLGQRTDFERDQRPDIDEVLSQVLKVSPRPVVVVPENPTAAGSVIVGYDASVQAARALQSYLQSGLYADLPIHVVAIDDDKTIAARRADLAAEYAHSHGRTAYVHAIADSRPGAALIKYLTETPASLAVMGAYGRGSVAEFFFGSTTRTLLLKSPAPLFLYA